MKKRFYILLFMLIICSAFLSATVIPADVKAPKQNIEEIFKKAKERLAELQVKIEEERRLARIEVKAKQIAELDAEAKSLMGDGDYKKAKDVYEKILKISAEDPDLRDYIKRADIKARQAEAEKLRQEKEEAKKQAELERQKQKEAEEQVRLEKEKQAQAAREQSDFERAKQKESERQALLERMRQEEELQKKSREEENLQKARENEEEKLRKAKEKAKKEAERRAALEKARQEESRTRAAAEQKELVKEIKGAGEAEDIRTLKEQADQLYKEGAYEEAEALYVKARDIAKAKREDLMKKKKAEDSRLRLEKTLEAR